MQNWNKNTLYNTTYKQYGLQALPKGLCIFMWSQNLLGFALGKKNKSKQKDFTMCVAESKRLLAPVLFIAQPLATSIVNILIGIELNIIKNIREKLGYTQLELAKKTGLSLRTIQRLESSNKKPRGHTLTVLSEIFNMDSSVLQEKFKSIEQTKKQETSSIRLINLSVLAFLGIPFGNIILPVILWKRKRKSKLVDEFGRRIINFQILWSAIFCLLLCIAPFVNKFFFSGTPLILVVLFSAMAINIIIVCATAIKLQRDNFDFLNLPIRFI